MRIACLRSSSASRIAAPNRSRYRRESSLSSGTCTGAGAAGADGFAAEVGEAPAADGAGEEPVTSGCELSGDWGALDSSAMDPGTLGCTWTTRPEARRRHGILPLNIPQKMAHAG